MEWFGNKNPQLLKAGGTLCDILTEQNEIVAKNMIVGDIEIVTVLVILLFLIPVVWNIYKTEIFKKFSITRLIKILNKSLIIQVFIVIFLILVNWAWNKANFKFENIIAGTLYTYLVVGIFMYLPSLGILNLIKFILQKRAKTEAELSKKN
ncbi:hypothetical protein [Flavobacterium sp. N1946]|uniref:hypothetical protein n=2 Tax=Flavobacterium TaxID=237 RepID=UPI0022242D14|nr:hypothetical protein [Flavobacterium sp. N1946]